MKTLEIWLYREIFGWLSLSSREFRQFLFLKNYELLRNEIWKSAFSLDFLDKLSDYEKELIVKAFDDIIETEVLSILRLLEGDLYECDWYAPPIDPDDYMESHPDYQGGLLRVVDLEWKSITDNSMYENFIAYMEDKKDKTSS